MLFPLSCQRSRSSTTSRAEMPFQAWSLQSLLNKTPHHTQFSLRPLKSPHLVVQDFEANRPRPCLSYCHVVTSHEVNLLVSLHTMPRPYSASFPLVSLPPNLHPALTRSSCTIIFNLFHLLALLEIYPRLQTPHPLSEAETPFSTSQPSGGSSTFTPFCCFQIITQLLLCTNFFLEVQVITLRT